MSTDTENFVDITLGKLAEIMGQPGRKSMVLSYGLKFLGLTQVIMGIIAFFFLIKVFSMEAFSMPNSHAGITIGEFLIAFSVVAYQVLVGFFCIGFTDLLAEVNRSSHETLVS